MPSAHTDDVAVASAVAASFTPMTDLDELLVAAREMCREGIA